MNYLSILLVGMAPLVPSAAVADSPVDQAVSKHMQTLQRVQSYHVRFETLSLEDDQPGTDLQRETMVEVWLSGVRRRSLRRVYSSLGPTGFEKLGENGEVWDTSVDAQQSRSLSGWDPEHPFKLPLEWGRSIREFQSVSCAIEPFDPTMLDRICSEERAALLWQIAGHSLREISDMCDLDVVEQPDPSVTRLKINAIRSDALRDSFLAPGATLDLDHHHGWLVKTIESKPRNRVLTWTVTKYVEGAPKFWYPAECRLNAEGQVEHSTRIIAAEFNPALDDQQLTTQFPQGARVTENPGAKIHIWGEREPVATFDNSNDMLKYLHGRARDVQRGTSIVPQPRSSNVIVANALVTAVLGALYLVRRIFLGR